MYLSSGFNQYLFSTQCQRNLSKTNISSPEYGLADESDKDVEELDAGDEGDNDFISTQR